MWIQSSIETPTGSLCMNLSNSRWAAALCSFRATHMPPSTSTEWTLLQPPTIWRLTALSVRTTLFPRRPPRSNRVMEGSENSCHATEREEEKRINQRSGWRVSGLKLRLPWKQTTTLAPLCSVAFFILCNCNTWAYKATWPRHHQWLDNWWW